MTAIRRSAFFVAGGASSLSIYCDNFRLLLYRALPDASLIRMPSESASLAQKAVSRHLKFWIEQSIRRAASAGKSVTVHHPPGLENRGAAIKDPAPTNLARANLRKCSTYERAIGAANLTEADLSFPTLTQADLSKANLLGADLFRAALNGGNLRQARLSGAELREANLSSANLDGIWMQFESVKMPG